MVTLDLGKEGLQHPYCHLVGAVVIITVTGEVALSHIVYIEASLITDDFHLGILHGTDRVDHMREAGNTRSKGTAHISIDKGHLSCLIEVLVVHIVDEVQRVHINVSEPVEHIAETGLQFFPCEVLAGDGTELRTALLAGLGIHTAVDGVEQGLGHVGTGTEELHLLTGLSGRHTTADAVVIAPDRTHHIVVLILDRAGLH